MTKITVDAIFERLKELRDEFGPSNQLWKVICCEKNNEYYGIKTENLWIRGSIFDIILKFCRFYKKHSCNDQGSAIDLFAYYDGDLESDLLEFPDANQEISKITYFERYGWDLTKEGTVGRYLANVLNYFFLDSSVNPNKVKKDKLYNKPFYGFYFIEEERIKRVIL